MEETVTVQIDFPKSFVIKLDNAAKDLRSKTKVMPKFEWMTRDPQGKAIVDEVLGPKYKHLTTKQANDKIDEEYRRHTGGPITGRPNIRDQRLIILMAAVNAYLKEPSKVTPLAPNRPGNEVSPLRTTSARG